MIAPPDTPTRIAERAVDFVERKFGVVLPYNPPSLILVDAIVDKIKATGASEQQASGLLMGLGFYVGEVFVRNARATWRATAEMRMSKVCTFPMVVALPGAVGCNPIGQVFERFRAGDGASVATFYQRTLAPPPVGARGH
ncbi:MAG TPA: hypothetical protein VFM88_23730 [Vicinamibacteria bacterium]|nr:hypothetical protein [Vicinamibacteria bacterium]